MTVSVPVCRTQVRAKRLDEYERIIKDIVEKQRERKELKKKNSVLQRSLKSSQVLGSNAAAELPETEAVCHALAAGGGRSSSPLPGACSGEGD